MNKLDKNIGLRDFDELDDYNRRVIEEDLSKQIACNLENKKMRYQFYKKFPQKKSLALLESDLDTGALQNLADYDFKNGIRSQRMENSLSNKPGTDSQPVFRAQAFGAEGGYFGTIAYSNNSIISAVFPKTYPVIHP